MPKVIFCLFIIVNVLLAEDVFLAKSGKVLFQDDFAKLDSAWSTKIGNWKVENGIFTGSEKTENKHQAVSRKMLNFSNAVFSFDFQLANSKAISLSLNDAKEHVARLSINKDGWTLQKDDHDHEGPDKAVIFEAKKVALDTKVWHHARVEIVGSEIFACVDDMKTFGSHPLIACAKANFGFTVGGEPASFKNLVVAEALPNENWAKIKLTIKTN
jgi:hypothetical protein